jgi:hypothetical protein
MKQKRKHLLKKFLIFGIAFLLASCSEELYDEAIDSSNKRTIKEVKFNELYKDSKFKNLLEKVSHNSNAARTSFENQNGFTISDGFVKVIETDSVVSYTMLIERDVVTDTISFENLVIQENSLGVQKAKILKYTPTTITLSGHDSFYFDGSIIKKNIAFTGFNKNTSNNTTLAECYTYILQFWCWQPYNNQTTHHVAGSECSPNTTYIKAVKVLSPDDCGSTGGSGSDDSFGDPYSNPGSGGGGVTGNTETTPEEDVITSPVKPGLDGVQQKTPCTLLNKLKIDTNFIGRMKGLAYASSQVLFEKCHVLYSNPNSTNSNNFTYQNFEGTVDKPQVNYSGNTSMKGIIHSHYEGLLSIFSVTDLADYYEKMKMSEISDDFFIGVVCPQGNAYIMQIKDRAAFIAFGDKHLSTEDKRKRFERDFCQKKYNIKIDNPTEDNENGFVKMLKEMNIGTSIAKSTFVPSAAVTSNTTVFKSWTDLIYNETTENVEPQTCN